MWQTWLGGLSGNANFFYFQTIVYNGFLVILYLMVFKGFRNLIEHDVIDKVELTMEELVHKVGYKKREAEEILSKKRE